MEMTQYIVRIHPAAEGGFWAEVPALPGCFGHGGSVELATLRVREAMECHLAELALAGERPPVEKSPRRSYAIPVTVRAPRRV